MSNGYHEQSPENGKDVVRLDAIRDAMRDVVREVASEVVPPKESSDIRHIREFAEATRKRYAEESETSLAKTKARKWWATRVITPVAIAVLSGGGYGGYRVVTAEGVDDRVDHVERKLQRLGENTVEMQVQQVESTEYIADKIDAAHPREADDVAEPESLQAAKRKVSKIKRRKAVEQMFQDVDPDDPLEDEE